MSRPSTRIALSVAVALGSVIGGVSNAQMQHPGQGNMGPGGAAQQQRQMPEGRGPMMGSPQGKASGPAAREYEATKQKMHKAMQIPYTGDADRDFAANMIAHHQGAIDMARVELKHGKDQQLQQLAAKVIEDQEKEIATLRAWLGDKTR